MGSQSVALVLWTPQLEPCDTPASRPQDPSSRESMGMLPKQPLRERVQHRRLDRAVSLPVWTDAWQDGGLGGSGTWGGGNSETPGGDSRTRGGTASHRGIGMSGHGTAGQGRQQDTGDSGTQGQQDTGDSGTRGQRDTAVGGSERNRDGRTRGRRDTGTAGHRTAGHRDGRTRESGGQRDTAAGGSQRNRDGRTGGRCAWQGRPGGQRDRWPPSTTQSRPLATLTLAPATWLQQQGRHALPVPDQGGRRVPQAVHQVWDVSVELTGTGHTCKVVTTRKERHDDVTGARDTWHGGH